LGGRRWRQRSGRSHFLRCGSKGQEKYSDDAGKNSFHAIRPFSFESQNQINILMWIPDEWMS
jgi:hypothetical protein